MGGSKWVFHGHNWAGSWVLVEIASYISNSMKVDIGGIQLAAGCITQKRIADAILIK